MSAAALRVALVGNPNCGKTALFNQLTGGRQKVANYAGVTVERKVGRFVAPSGRQIQVLDLPGAYSFDSTSPDERITRDVLLGRHPGEAPPDLVVCVADATNLRLHLRFVLEVQRLGRPVVLALNMMDAAERRGIRIDIDVLARELGVQIVQTVAVRRGGASRLVDVLDRAVANAPAAAPPAADDTDDDAIHARVRALLAAAVVMPRATDVRDDRLDHWALHPVFGLVILAAVMFLVFQAVYSIGKPITDAIGDGFTWLGALAGAHLPDGPLRGLVTDGLIGGLGTVLGFLPEILVLFLFILVLEESGYLPRAAFLLDRMMVSVGLTGRSFIPLLSSFACAIPGVLGTRSITDPRDRLATILVAPLMTCSARLPVYALLIGAFIPSQRVLGIFNLQGVVLFALYAAGIGGAMLVGWIMKKLRGPQGEHALLMELPSYRLPRVRDVAIGLWERGSIFMKRLTGVILALTVLMWFISTFPSPPAGAVGPAIDYTFAGYLGRALQYVFAPLGFNWQISLSLIPAFAARETAVAALATVYAVSGGDADIASVGHALAANFSLASALSLLVWFAFAPQCMSTLAVIRRETGSWRNVAISFGYMFVMAYAASFVTYQVARALT
ncbi:ferrous iron transporter B [Burkholderia pseudomultivorans]|uniref:Fe(2+) transporter FeoB n=4 Tax=Burkholderia pseudomultivorans TaxID=1207504 RepID=A0A6P2KS06_9BURK|nr:ferrous iron transporter B [Burkholderia pseudomultivorans]MDR8730001.1 Fe(2+) transporter FeoB [Burkholderia pseudomultivorans]MDR8735843.1 Fe(2+) transporter FeoB [Burkholderia pseudomultivorans]MDR8744342.1 Fe(2+) transporter FeoB [Burkholderia pseudomultivorans]MDR8756101.1 Fe(2+) transporter FeoB [Burkholderia pseudomultivorans]MDR8780998.1 Fe(2+) transporter FeoB [Burkholderia pseudomultivorans]